MTKAILSLSGGIDSCVSLALALSEKKEMESVYFFYGSKHEKYELASARMIASHYGISLRELDLKLVLSGFRSSLLGTDVIPEGHQESESMRSTVVPGRNTIFASVLMGIAESESIDQVWLGVHKGDRAIYPDCRPLWVGAVGKVMEAATEGKVSLSAPLLYYNKTEIVQLGMRLKAPLYLTRTCYKDQPIACGKCGACQERLEAFRNNQIDDPIEYEFRGILPRE